MISSFHTLSLQPHQHHRVAERKSKTPHILCGPDNRVGRKGGGFARSLVRMVIKVIAALRSQATTE